VREQVVQPHETAVALLTGHLLKDTEAVTNYHFGDVAGAPRPGANRPLRVAADLPALERALADALHG
jgi:threonine synthase